MRGKKLSIQRVHSANIDRKHAHQFVVTTVVNCIFEHKGCIVHQRNDATGGYGFSGLSSSVLCSSSVLRSALTFITLSTGLLRRAIFTTV